EIRVKLGENDAAVAAFRKARAADAEDRHGATVWLMRLGAEDLSAMPRGYVQTLFGLYAPRFGAALIGCLVYRAPRLLFKVGVSGCESSVQVDRLGPARCKEAVLLQARDRSRLRHRIGRRRFRQGGRSFHRHRPVAEDAGAGARHRPLR